MLTVDIYFVMILLALAVTVVADRFTSGHSRETRGTAAYVIGTLFVWMFVIVTAADDRGAPWIKNYMLLAIVCIWAGFTLLYFCELRRQIRQPTVHEEAMEPLIF